MLSTKQCLKKKSNQIRNSDAKFRKQSHHTGDQTQYRTDETIQINTTVQKTNKQAIQKQAKSVQCLSKIRKHCV